MSTLELFSFLAAIGAAILGLVGGVMARSLKPDSAKNVREIVETIEPFISGQKQLLETLLLEVRTKGGLPATWTPQQLIALQIAENRSAGAHQRISTWKALDTTAESSKAGLARLFMVLGACSAALSAALQLISAACGAA